MSKENKKRTMIGFASDPCWKCYLLDRTPLLSTKIMINQGLTCSSAKGVHLKVRCCSIIVNVIGNMRKYSMLFGGK